MGRLPYTGQKRGEISIVERLIERGADVNFKESSTMTPLMVASREGHLSIAELLLSKGANIHEQYND